MIPENVEWKVATQKPLTKTFNTIAFVTRSAPARKRSLGVNALSVQVAVVLKRLALINI